MRNMLAMVFLFTLLIPVHFSSAVYTPSVGSQTNPLYIQVEQDPTQLWNDAWNKINSMQYVAACSAKYDSVKSLATKNGFGNIADPFTAKSEANYLNYLYSSYQLCVNNALQIQSPEYSNQICINKFGQNSMFDSTWNNTGRIKCICKNGYQLNDSQTSCIVSVIIPVSTSLKSDNQICIDKYGSNVLFKEFDPTDGKRVCDCKSGYVWNEQRTSCVVAPIKTNDQACSDKFGQSWKWDGTKNSGGFLNCGCIDGYTQKNGECTVSPTAPAKKNDQICIEDYGINSTWSGKLNEKNGPICDCKINYVWNKGGTTCLAIPKAETKTITPLIKKVSEVKKDTTNITEADPVNLDKVIVANTDEVKSKGFWARLKGWLGF